MIDLKKEAYLRQCIEAFYFGYREFTAQPDRILEDRGLNRVHHRILYFIGRNPGIGVGALLDILQVSKQALHAPLRQLIEMGLVRNESARFDRRVKQLSLTLVGGELEHQLTEVQMDLLQAAMDDSAAGAGDHWLEMMRSITAK